MRITVFLHENTFDSDPDEKSHCCLFTLIAFSLALELTVVLWCQVENLCHDLSASHVVIRNCLGYCGEVLAGVSQLNALISDMTPYNMQQTALLKVIICIAG